VVKKVKRSINELHKKILLPTSGMYGKLIAIDSRVVSGKKIYICNYVLPLVLQIILYNIYRRTMGGAKKQRSKRAVNRADDLLDQFDDMKGEILNNNKSNIITSSQVNSNDDEKEMRFQWLDHDTSNHILPDGSSARGVSIAKNPENLTKHGDRHQVNYGKTKYIKP